MLLAGSHVGDSERISIISASGCLETVHANQDTNAA